MGLRRQRHLRDERWQQPRHLPQLRDPGHLHSRPAGHRQRRQDRHDDAARSASTAAKSANTATRCSPPPASSTTGAWARPPAAASPTAPAPAPPPPSANRPWASPAASETIPTARRSSTASTTPPKPRSTSRAPMRRRSSSGSSGTTTPTTTAWRWSSPPTSTKRPAASWSIPNAPQFGGTFGVGIGSGTSRNTVYFERPSAGEWHHYAFVLDTSAPAAQQITPLRRRQSRRLPEGRQRHRRRQLRQLDAQLHVACGERTLRRRRP